MSQSEAYRPIPIENKGKQGGLPSSGEIFVISTKPQNFEFQTQENERRFKATPRIIDLQRKHNQPMQELLNDLYYKKKMNQAEIADYLEGINQSTISIWMKLLGISPRSRHERQKVAWEHPERVKGIREKKLRDRAEALGAESAEEQKEILENMYFAEGTLKKVSLRLKREGFNVGDGRVGKWFKELGAKRTVSKEEITRRSVHNRRSPRLKKERQAFVKSATESGDIYKLPAKERETLIRRYDGNETLEEIAKDRGVTKEAIRQTEEGALRRLGLPGSDIKNGKLAKTVGYKIMPKGRPKIVIPKEAMEEHRGRLVREVAEELGVGRGVVIREMRSSGIELKMRKAGRPKKFA